jgi:hypothetical protein
MGKPMKTLGGAFLWQRKARGINPVLVRSENTSCPSVHKEKGTYYSLDGCEQCFDGELLFVPN